MILFFISNSILSVLNLKFKIKATPRRLFVKDIQLAQGRGTLDFGIYCYFHRNSIVKSGRKYRKESLNIFCKKMWNTPFFF